jgi:hypothetical protein
MLRAGCLGPRRLLAILPQPPAFSKADLKKELQLRREAEYAAARQRQWVREQAVSPQFAKAKKPAGLLRYYMGQRERLTTRDAVAAFYRVAKLARAAAHKVGGDPLASHPLMATLRDDVEASVPHLQSRELCNALLAASYLRLDGVSSSLVGAVCAAAAERAEMLSLRDVSTALYSLGRLGRADEALLPRLLSRVTREAGRLHAIEMGHAASGLADLGLAPPSALSALSRAAVPKMEQFGAEELPRLLSSLSSLGVPAFINFPEPPSLYGSLHQFPRAAFLVAPGYSAYIDRTSFLMWQATTMSSFSESRPTGSPSSLPTSRRAILPSHSPRTRARSYGSRPHSTSSPPRPSARCPDIAEM